MTLEVQPIDPSSFSARCRAFTADSIARASDWSSGREWAVGVFMALSSIALSCAIARSAVDRASAKRGADSKQSVAFAAFQRSYLAVYVVVMLADWMQGTHMYTLYTKYQETNSAVKVGTLFFSGFMAAGILGKGYKTGLSTPHQIHGVRLSEAKRAHMS